MTRQTAMALNSHCTCKGDAALASVVSQFLDCDSVARKLDHVGHKTVMVQNELGE